MKKLSILLFALIISLTSCKNEKKDTKTETTTEKYVVKPEGTSVTWTAYKTTEKKGVGGEFSVLKFENKTGNSAQEALNGLSFSIPISGLFTKDTIRDAKLIKSFFGSMLDPDLIKGKIKYTNDVVVASITMNGVTNNLPLEISITDDRRVTMSGTMNLKDWDALGALEALNKVCFDLHKGPDGVSKTWEDVAIEVSTFLRKN